MRINNLTVNAQHSLQFDSNITGEVRRAANNVTQARLPTNTTTAGHLIHRWFNFIAGFSPEFVDQVCREVIVNPDPVLLDPFSGCGTAPLEAAMQGMHVIGYEAHPFFERICRAKLVGHQALSRVADIEATIAFGLNQPVDSALLANSPRLFLEKLFPKDILSQLLGARTAIESSPLANDPLAFLALSKIVDRSSHSSTDGVYKAPTTKKRAISPMDALSQICAVLREDLEALSCNNKLRSAQLFGGSSEAMTEIRSSSVSIVVTSPPYLNNFDYAEMTRMYLYFWGMATSWGDITDRVRSRLIVNTTTALKGHKNRQALYRNQIPWRLHKELDEIVTNLAVRRTEKAGKKEYDKLVYPYFAQMTTVLRECFRVMKTGAPMHIMVADAALYGIHIRAHLLLTDIITEIGFRSAKCSLVRRRGHRWVLNKREGAEDGLGEYHIVAKK